jgi:transketolase
MRDAFVQKLELLAENDKDTVLITGDLGFGMFDNFREKFPQQFINVGVAEQNMIGIATGLALEGKKVFVYSIANFATLRCLEQIRNDAAYHRVNITIVASGGGFTYGALGMSHHATEDIAILRALPDITVVVPSTAWEAGCATQMCYSINSVCYLRIEKGGNKEPPFNQAIFNIGKAIKLREGKDITFISCGGIISEVEKAAFILEDQGVESRILSMHTIKPIDRDAITKAVQDTGCILTIEEHNAMGGLGSAVSEVLMIDNLHAVCGQICLQDEYSSIVGNQKYLRNYYKLDSDSIVCRALDLLLIKNNKI